MSTRSRTLRSLFERPLIFEISGLSQVVNSDRLKEEEQFAIRKLFSSSHALASAVENKLQFAKVLERVDTVVGFMTTVSLPLDIPASLRIARDWNFHHAALAHGGSFMCFFAADGLLGLEGVVFDGVWPKPFRESDFVEM
jgi:hypothetical protein